MNRITKITGAPGTVRTGPRQPEGAAAPQSLTPSPGTQTEKRAETGGPVLPPVGAGSPTFPCRNCEGSGHSEYMGLNEDRYHWRTCWDCDGSGVEEPYCGVCGGKLNPALYCHACDEFESLVYVERISPTRIAC